MIDDLQWNELKRQVEELMDWKTHHQGIDIGVSSVAFPHPAQPYVPTASSSWVDLTDGGTTTLHSHTGAAMKKITGSGYQVMPAAATGIDPAVSGGAAWSNGAWSEVVASTSEADYILGFTWMNPAATIEAEICLGIGAAGAETEIAYWPIQGNANTIEALNPVMIPFPIPIATTTRVAVRVRCSSTVVVPSDIRFIYCKQSDLVDL